MHLKDCKLLAACLLLAACGVLSHEAKDFDDSILYKIDFEVPDFDTNPSLKDHVRTFYTNDKEKYDCVIPPLSEAREEKKTDEPELSPYTLLEPIFSTPSCSYRIEAYWSYEICHGHHVRQYHEEREGKTLKSQEYYLGKWADEKKEQSLKSWEEDRKAGIRYKTTKIDNTKYPYFELEMTDGTMCDIINAPRTTVVRYVCYPHGKNEIYSFKETSSCNYEAIILTSVLCIIPAFHPEESKEVSIKCFNSPTDTHKPISMLRQELNEMQISDDDFPGPKDGQTAATALARSASGSDRFLSLNKFDDVNRLVLELMADMGVFVETSAEQGEGIVEERPQTDVTPVDLSPIKEFISGKNCLTGGTGWWRYEFCYGRHVRQFHKDKKSETELYLGFFSDEIHRQWLKQNPEKARRTDQQTTSLWHHYEKGTRCDRTGLPREVDVKLICLPLISSSSAVSMYLLEPKTCQYILVVESTIVCDLMKFADEYGLVNEENIEKILQKDVTSSEADLQVTISSPETVKHQSKPKKSATTSPIVEGAPMPDEVLV